MALIVNKAISKKWFNHDDKGYKLLIRPLAASLFLEKLKVDGNSKGELEEVDIIDQFIYCLVDWKDISDVETKKKLTVNNDNKRFLYDYSPSIVADVFNGATELGQQIVKKENKEIKN